MPRARANGLDFEYESFGRNADPAVLLIMGFSAQMTVWPTAFCEGLAARGFRVIRFDNRDIGLSTHLARLGTPNVMEAMARRMSGQPVANAPYLLNDMAADAAGLLDALGIEAAHIVGASMGGMIAQIFGAEYPQKTLSLVSIMSTTGDPGLPQAKPEAMAALTTPPASDSRADRIAQGMHVWRVIGSPGYPLPEAELRAFVESLIDRAPYDPAGVARQLVAIIASPPRTEILKNVRAPALVVHGEDDPLVPVEGGRHTAQCIPGCGLVTLPGVGHDISNALVPIYLKHVGAFLSTANAQAKAAE